MIRLALGVLTILIGAGILAWIAFNVFVEMQPRMEGKSPLIGTAVAGLMIVSGVLRIRAYLKQRREQTESQTSTPD